MSLTRQQRARLRTARRILADLGHRDLESFALAVPSVGADELKYAKLERMLIELRDAAHAELAVRQTASGRELLELAIFNAVRDGSDDPVADIVNSVLSQGLHEPGFVLYPMFGFGLLDEPDASPVSSPLHLIDPTAGLAVTSRVRTPDALLAFLIEASAGLGVVGKLSKSAVDYILTMRNVVGWVLSNPLLLVRVRSITMGAREAESIFLRSVAYRGALLGLISNLSEPRGSGPLRSGSTQSTSNQDTLDFRHYFAFGSPGDPAQTVKTERISMGPRRARFIRLSDLSVDIDPTAWLAPAPQAAIDALTNALLDLEDLEAAVTGRTPVGRHKENVSRQLSASLHWVRRSFASLLDPREAVVAVAAAFETLLSDGPSDGTVGTIIERGRTCLAHTGAVPALADAIEELFDWRDAIVHGGAVHSAIDLRLARRAYIWCFISVVRRTRSARQREPLIIAHLFPASSAGSTASGN